jgi:hypothetical protein
LENINSHHEWLSHKLVFVERQLVFVERRDHLWRSSDSCEPSPFRKKLSSVEIVPSYRMRVVSAHRPLRQAALESPRVSYLRDPLANVRSAAENRLGVTLAGSLMPQPKNAIQRPCCGRGRPSTASKMPKGHIVSRRI